jgi:Tfp pilus assembly protein PilN
MYQQINLYQPVFRRQIKIFSAATLLQILAAVTVLLLGIHAYAQWTLSDLQQVSSSLEQQHQQLEAQLGMLGDSHQSPDTTVLDAEISRLQNTITKRRDLLGSVDRLTIKTSPGFSQFFEALTRNLLPGLWLTSIRLVEDGETELRGTTLHPQLVPRYLQQMHDQPRFNSLATGSVHLVRRAPGKSEVDFVLRSSEPGQVSQ